MCLTSKLSHQREEKIPPMRSLDDCQEIPKHDNDNFTAEHLFDNDDDKIQLSMKCEKQKLFGSESLLSSPYFS